MVRISIASFWDNYGSILNGKVVGYVSYQGNNAKVIFACDGKIHQTLYLLRQIKYD